MSTTKTERTEATEKKAARRGKGSGILPLLRVMIGILILAVIALSVVLYLAETGKLGGAQTDAAPLKPLFSEEPAESVVYTLICVTPLEEALTVTAPAGETVSMPDAPQIDGYVFLGWTDSLGAPVEQTEFVLDSDLSFRAVYVPAFRDGTAETVHTAYLSVDENGFFHPDEALSRREAAVILYSLLEPGLSASGSFEDVPADDDCHEAAAALKDLGVVGGASFRPDDAISCGELFDMLSHFFPKAAEEHAFDSIPAEDPHYGAFCLALEKGWIDDPAVSPDSALTRRAAARVFNRISGRSPVAEQDYSRVGTILDVSFRDPDFWEIAEAAIPHEAELAEGGERWSASEALELRGEGTFFIGTELHCVDAEGSAVVNDFYGSFEFGPDGVITTGMPELDACVQDTLRELVDPSTMDSEQMLRTLYNFVTYRNSYLGARRDQLHEVGDTSWVNEAAYRMFTAKKGCCYNYSAEFYVLARAIGYDAVIYSGKINPPPNQRAHGWVEIEFDGVPYIFDTELEYTQVIAGHTGTVYYKISYERVKGWYYFRG